MTVDEAFPRLYVRLHTWIERDVGRKWTFRDKDSPKDVFLEFMRRVVRSVSLIDHVVENGGSLQALLWTIATRAANDRWNWEQKRIAEPHWDRQFYEGVPPALNPEEACFRTEKLQIAHEVVSKLSLDDQDLLERYSEDKPAQIALDLGRDVTEVRKQIARLLRQIRRAVDERMKPCHSQKATYASTTKPSGAPANTDSKPKRK
jgi:DNA-directed RNA polymerase specialized sigma24 family protein